MVDAPLIDQEHEHEIRKEARVPVSSAGHSKCVGRIHICAFQRAVPRWVGPKKIAVESHFETIDSQRASEKWNYMPRAFGGVRRRFERGSFQCRMLVWGRSEFPIG